MIPFLNLDIQQRTYYNKLTAKVLLGWSLELIIYCWKHLNVKFGVVGTQKCSGGLSILHKV